MLKQSLQQKLLQKLSPQQIQLMKLLQLPTTELEVRIKEELEANPALEEGAENDRDEDDLAAAEEQSEALDDFDFDDYLDDETPDYRLSARNQGADVEDKTIPFSGGTTFFERLHAQLSLLDVPEESRELADHIIGNLDEAGYLRRDLESIVNDLAFTEGKVVERAALEEALSVVQTLDPAGVGARDLKECLQLQLQRKFDSEDRSTAKLSRRISQRIALEILEFHFESFSKKHFERIQKKLDIDEEALKDALAEITQLNPKPGNSGAESSRGTAIQVVPDFLLSVEDNELRLQLNQRNAPELRISPMYKEMMETYASGAKTNSQQKDALTFVKQKIDSAKWFVDAIRQRQLTLTLTMQAIVDHQHDYFLSGDETDLRPMILKDIADVVQMDISTVSRVAKSKYVQTPYGTFLLKSFFSESLTTETGEEVSSREVKKILQEAIEGEDKRKPLSDEKLGHVLNAKGYNIARRTVAKYREQLGIPVARLRKELS
ncbi:MAG: RNA polymerase sigma-54 factor [Crocinitomicaceae bacterium TMED209]|nr:MAG: RNA polymerase sigma-54 factor [Crocinitomicaceae bacterium TMED209]